MPSFARGSLKIGTLYEYRKVEHYGEVDLGSDTHEADFFRRHVLRPDQQASKVKIVLADGARIVAHSNSPDLYIYCVSSEYYPEVMTQFGCDACVEIVNPERFFRAISRRIRHQANFDGYGAVQYMNKKTHYKMPHQVHPAVMKDLEFSYQKEWRGIWVSCKKLRGPLFVDVPKAVRYCRIYEP